MAAPAAVAARGAAGRVGARSGGRAASRRGTQRAPSTGAATKTEQARLKAQARKGDTMLDEIFKQGVEEGRRARPAAKTAKKRRRRPPASVRRAARELRRPVATQVGGGLRLIGTSLAVVGLYVALENAPAAAGVIGAAQRALAWLASPTRSIPYGGSS